MLFMNNSLDNTKRIEYINAIKKNIIDMSEKDKTQTLKNIIVFLKNSEDDRAKIYPFRELVKNLGPLY